MSDRLTGALDALDRIPSPLRWDDIERRAGDGAVDVTELQLGARPGRSDTRPRRAVLVAAVVLTLVGVVGVLIIVGGDDPVRTGPGPDRGSTTATPAPTTGPSPSIDEPAASTPTTLPAVGTSWGAAVEVWTGSEYLVWGGQVGDDARGRADGWRVTPGGPVREVPVAPIAPRDSAAGVWTGTELIVCCGRSMGVGPAYDTASSAAFDPATDTWRVLADPPAEANGYVIGAAWTGSEVLVVMQVGDPSLEAFEDATVALFAYDPLADTWGERATPIRGDRFGEVVWTGRELVIWSQAARGTDAGVSYDPVVDEWTELPDLPADHPTTYGSAATVDGELVVFGLDGGDRTRAIGYRLRPGDAAWRELSPAPLPPIDAYEGTPGSQTLLADPGRGRVIVYPTNGYESGAGGAEGGPPRLLAYDLADDSWSDIGDLGGAPYHPALLVGGDRLYRPDRAAPEALDLGP